MPSTSDKQKRLMAAVANNPKFAKQVGIPQSVGKEFQREDKKMANCGSKRKPTAMKKGGMLKYAAGGKLNMVKKGDKMVPDFAADGVGKMAYGGRVKAKKKGGGMTMDAPRGSKGPAYDAMLDREAEKKRKRDEGKAKPSKAVQTMRRQQKELDARMADMPRMRTGGKVRGAGMAKKGVRPCKMR